MTHSHTATTTSVIGTYSHTLTPKVSRSVYTHTSYNYSLTHLKCHASCQGTEDTPCVATYPHIIASTRHKENYSKCHTQSYINGTVSSHIHTGHMWCHRPSQSESATLRYSLPHRDLTLTPYKRLSAPSQDHPTAAK